MRYPVTAIWRRSAPILAFCLLSACDPAEVMDSALKRTAYTVVYPVVNIDLPGEPARLATNCRCDRRTAKPAGRRRGPYIDSASMRR